MRKRVLIVGQFLSASNGTRGVCEELAVLLRELGWQVSCTSEKPGRAARVIDMLTTIWAKRNDFTIAQVDVFSGAAFRWAEAACCLLRRLRKPFVLTLHGGNLPTFAKAHQRRVAKLLRAATAVTAPSAYLMDRMLQYRRDIILLPNPINLQHYPFRTRRLATPRLIWLRAFHELYNPRLVVRVLAYLLEKGEDVTALLIGPDKGDGSLQAAQRLAQELNISRRCSFEGPITKEAVPSWLNKGDIFLNTTNVDNTPVSVIEALACGLCVVSTNVGGIPFLLADGVDALLVPPNDAARMAEAVLKLCRNSNLAEKLSANARAKAGAFDQSAVLPQWESLLLDNASAADRLARQQA